MADFGSPVSAALLAVVISAAIVGLSKWDVFYDKNTGSLRNFGVKDGETLEDVFVRLVRG